MGWGEYSKMDIDFILNQAHCEDGIFIYEESEKIGSAFSDETQNDLFAMEDSSWWFQYRASVIFQMAKRFFNPQVTTIDVGGGNGYTTKYMQDRHYKMALMEPSLEACLNAKKRGIETIICGTMSQEHIKDSSIKQICLLDVLEHVEDDIGFLKLLQKKLSLGGRVLITVPAFPLLWSSEDNAAGHFRRYRLEELKSAAKESGFSIVYVNYFFGFLFLPILLFRVGLEKLGLQKRVEERTERERKEIAEKQFKLPSGGVALRVLTSLEQTERNRFMKNKKVYFGSSILCVVEKSRSKGEYGVK